MSRRTLQSGWAVTSARTRASGLISKPRMTCRRRKICTATRISRRAPRRDIARGSRHRYDVLATPAACQTRNVAKSWKNSMAAEGQASLAQRYFEQGIVLSGMDDTHLADHRLASDRRRHLRHAWT